MLYIAESPNRGRGVFTDQVIEAEEIIECCPVITFTEQDVSHIRLTTLNYYYFEWGENETEGAIALGYGSLYNHAFQPNAAWRNKQAEKMIEFYATQRIAPGEEVMIDYGADYVTDLGFV
jgi:hypothetical protein